MNKISLTAAVALAAATMAPAAHAIDGTIEFHGAVVGVTCVINGGDKDMNVFLPTVSTDSLAAIGSEGGRTPFMIELTGCDPTTTKVSTFFEADNHVDPISGYLNIDVGGATNVQVALLNDEHDEIKVGAQNGQQNSQQVNVVDGAATLNYYVQYKSQGGATAGDVKTRVRYTIAYE